MTLPYYPRISIVTPSYNQGNFIEQTIQSIIDQKYPNLEYIIIDGGSTDNTKSILKKYSEFIFYWESNPDLGQAHALNKGFSKASGEICAYLNSDDLYLPRCLELVASSYVKNKFLWLRSKVLCGKSLEESDLFLEHISTYEEFCAQQTIGQQGVFWSSDAYPKPWFDQSLNYVMDHEFFIKLYENCGSPFNLDVITSFFRFHEEAKTSNLEDVLNIERNKVGIQAAERSKSLTQSIRIKKEIQRHRNKIILSELVVKVTVQETINQKINLLYNIILLSARTPYRFRDRVLLGYIKRAILNLFRGRNIG